MSEEKKQNYIAENADAEADTIFGGAPLPAPEPVTKKSGASRNVKALLAGICALVLLGGGLTAVLLLNRGDAADSDSSLDSTEEETIILNQNSAQIVSVDVKNTDTFTITCTPGAEEGDSNIYSIEGFDDIELDTSLLSTLVSNGAKLEAASLAEEDASDLAKYGLAEPAASVVLHYADGSEFRFTVGDIAPMVSGRNYCEVDGDVYLVRNSLVANYIKTTDKFLSLTLLKEPAKTEFPIVDSVRIERQDPECDMYLEYDYKGAEDGTVGGSAATHILREPVEAYLNLDQSLGVTTGMFGLTASEIAYIRPSDADLKKTGLDEPFCTVTMACDDGNTYHLAFGDTYETESGKVCYYAQFEEVPLIYGISEEKAVWCTVQPGDITSDNIFTTYVWNIGSLEITGGGQSLTFQGEGLEQSDYVVTKNGAECDTERFRQLFAFLLSVYGEDLYLGEAPTGTPDASVHVTTQNGKDDYTVEFYRQSAVKTIIKRGNACYSVRTSCLDALLHNLEIFDDTDTAFQTSWQ